MDEGKMAENLALWVKKRERSLKVRSILEMLAVHIGRRESLTSKKQEELQSLEDEKVKKPSSTTFSKIEGTKEELGKAKKELGALLAFQDNLNKWIDGEIEFEGDWDDEWLEVQKRLKML